MELRGGIVAETPSAAAQLQDALEDAVAGGPVLLQVSDATGVWERSVEVLNLTVDGRWIDSRYALTVDLYAPDPIRYRSATQVGPVGLPSHTGGLELPEAFPWHFGFEERAVALVENVGKLPVYPLARVVGSASAVSVHGGPRVLSFEEFSGELVFDSALRRAYLNGSDVTRRLTSRNWHEVPPLESQGFYLRAAAASSETTLTVEYRIGAW